MAELHFTCFSNIYNDNKAFDSILQSFFDCKGNPHHCIGSYNLRPLDMKKDLKHFASRVGRGRQMEIHYYTLLLCKDEADYLGEKLYGDLYSLGDGIIYLLSEYPAAFSVHEDHFSPELHILVSSIPIDPKQHSSRFRQRAVYSHCSILSLVECLVKHRLCTQLNILQSADRTNLHYDVFQERLSYVVRNPFTVKPGNLYPQLLI